MCCSLDLRAIANKSYPTTYVRTVFGLRYRRSTRVPVRIRCRSSQNCCRVELFEHVRYYIATRCPEQVHNCLLVRATAKYLRAYNKNSVEEISRAEKNNSLPLRSRDIYTYILMKLINSLDTLRFTERFNNY